MKSISFNWKNHPDFLKTTVKDLQSDDEFTDVTLVCDDKRKFEAHKVILSSCSPVFRNILQGTRNQNMVIFLRGIDYADMESILQFLYQGEVTLQEERVNDFLMSAKDLEIKELSVENVDSTIEGIEDIEKQQNAIVLAAPTPKKIQCIRCELQFDTTKLMKKHYRQVHEERKYACNYCDYRGFHMGHLKTHIDVKHRGMKIGSVFSNSAPLNLEDLKNEFVNPYEIPKIDSKPAAIPLSLPFSCDECEHSFSDHFNLERHVQTRHEGLIFRCEHCDHTSKRKDHLKEHVEEVHLGKKVYCSFCDYVSTKTSKLNAHLKFEHRMEKMQEKAKNLL